VLGQWANVSTVKDNEEAKYESVGSYLVHESCLEGFRRIHMDTVHRIITIKVKGS